MKRIIRELKHNWIKYGFETVAILIGILGAITLENWNENRQDKKELVSILRTIKSNLHSDIQKSTNSEGNTVEGIDFLNALINDPYNDSLADDFILNLKQPFNPMDNSGYKIAVSNNLMGLIKDEQLRNNITSYYESEYYTSNRYIKYLNETYSIIFKTTIIQSMDLKQDCDFACRIAALITDPSFVELLNSYMRLYSVVLKDLENRLERAQRLISRIDAELLTY